MILFIKAEYDEMCGYIRRIDNKNQIIACQFFEASQGAIAHEGWGGETKSSHQILNGFDEDAVRLAISDARWHRRQILLFENGEIQKFEDGTFIIRDKKLEIRFSKKNLQKLNL